MKTGFNWLTDYKVIRNFLTINANNLTNIWNGCWAITFACLLCNFFYLELISNTQTWKAIRLLSALSYRRDEKTWNGWPERTVLTPIMSVKKWHNNSFTENSKWQISEKRPWDYLSFKSRYIRSRLDFGEKILLTFVSYK